MDRGSFWQEILDMVKHHKRRSHSVKQLSEEQMAQVETNVYEHIDQLFPNSEIQPAIANSDVTPTVGSQDKSTRIQKHSLWARLFQGRQAPVFGMAVITLFSVGVLAFLFSGNRLSEPLFDIPDSVVAADVDLHIQIPQQNLRAFSVTLPSTRRDAFMAGVAQADLDLIGDSEKPAAHQIALWYHHITTGTPAVDALTAMKIVKSNVARFSDSEQSSLWLKQGYAVEVVHLAAKHSIIDLNASALNDALEFYRVNAVMPEPGITEPNNLESNSNGSDVPRQYIFNHEKLIVATPTQSPTPEQVQEIVDTTHNMKVLIQ